MSQANLRKRESNTTNRFILLHAFVDCQILLSIYSPVCQHLSVVAFPFNVFTFFTWQREVIRLKQCYNKCFQNTRAIKEREMYNIKEKNGRLRQIISEFNYFSDTKINIDINDPEWEAVSRFNNHMSRSKRFSYQIENVETDILRVADEEVPVRPYVSPSDQALLDAKAAEEERLRLLLLADDFRERALMAMMNGVLEIRWEDELKKDIPKPKCMVSCILFAIFYGDVLFSHGLPIYSKLMCSVMIIMDYTMVVISYTIILFI